MKVFSTLLYDEKFMRVGEMCSKDGRFLLAEVPLLYEVGWQDGFDVCVVVYVPKKFASKGYGAKWDVSRASPADFNAQIPIEKKLDYAHFIVDNSGTLSARCSKLAGCPRT